VTHSLVADRTVLRANATADNNLARIIGFVFPGGGIASAASGLVTIEGGSVRARFVGGLTLVDGDEIFLSTTSGRVTNVAPSTSGNVAQSIGILTDPLAYDGATDFIAEIQIVRGSKLVI